MKKPNFFIIGAPKCGTTSLAEYLKQHPNIFITEPKEPHYFNTDFANRYTKSEKEYAAYFTGVTDKHYAIGEASVFYLYSDEAVPNILRYNPDAKFIVMIRNPVDMVYSWHSQAVYSFGENVLDFRLAWSLQGDRKKGKKIPRYCSELKVLLYGDLCKVGAQMSRLFERVPRNRVLVILFDEFKANPGRGYKKVLEFLGVPSDECENFPIYNQNKKLRSPLVHNLYRLGGAVKRSLGINKGLGILTAVHRLNAKPVKRPPLPNDLRLELSRYFRDDVELLSRILGMDLKCWDER